MMRSLLQLSVLGLTGIILSACAAPVNDTRTYYLTDMERYQQAMRSGRRGEVPRWMHIEAGRSRTVQRASAPNAPARRERPLAPAPAPSRQRSVAAPRIAKPESRSSPTLTKRQKAAVVVAPTSSSTRPKRQKPSTVVAPPARSNPPAPAREVAVAPSATKRKGPAVSTPSQRPSTAPAPKPQVRAVAAPAKPPEVRSSRPRDAQVKVPDHQHTHYGRDEAYYERRPYYRPNSQYPVGKRRKDGTVESPYTGAKLPAQKIPSGARILDPSSGRVFINP